MIGVRVAEARSKLGISQSELARRAELTAAAIWQIERGERTPSADTLVKLSEALGVTSDWLLGRNNDTIESLTTDARKLALFRGLSNLSEHDQQSIMNIIESLSKSEIP